MLLFHFSDTKLSKIKVNFFGKNPFTNNDKKASNLKRSFFYTQLDNIEDRFKHKRYIHKCNVHDKSIYNLMTDSKHLISNDIDKTIRKIKKLGYKGVYYITGGLSIVNLFDSVKVNKIEINNN